MGVYAAIAVGALIVGAYEQHEAAQAAGRSADAQKEALKVQQKQANVEAHRARISQIREARIRAATVAAGASNAGAGTGTSGAQGAEGSIYSQAASNIGFINQTQTFSEQVSIFNQKAADEQSNIATHQANAAIASSIGSAALSWGSIKKGPKTS